MFVRGAALILVCLEQIYHFPLNLAAGSMDLMFTLILPRNSHVYPSMPRFEPIERSISTGGSERGRERLCDRSLQRASLSAEGIDEP